MEIKIEKKFFVFQIISSDFVALYRLYQGRIVAIALSVLGKSFKILHITNRDFLREY